jgi:membrane peptidoglycan carboxypeptidase
VSAEPRRRRAGLQGANGRRFRISRRWRRVLLFSGAGALLAVLVLAGMVVFAAMTLPNVDDIGKATGTIRILDRHGALIAEVGHDATTRTSVSIEQIAAVMRNATLAAEDRNFYSEGAFDFKRIVKAVIDDIVLRSPAEGASTITQQLAKQAFFGQQASKDPLRKIREALLANEIGGRYTKDQILALYMNITYYGENAYGIENASERYFGKHAAELTTAEAALLAGLPEAPSYNDPYKNPDAAFARMHYVLTGLVDMGKLTQAEAAAVDPLAGDAATQQQARQAMSGDLEHGKPNITVGPAPHFVQYIEDQLNDQLAQDPSYINGDLVVTTTLDLTMQQRAQNIVTTGVKQLGHGANNGALLMIDARTGEILAMVGSANYNDNSIAGQFNVVLGTRRPGSSFKPYVYETAFSEGVLKPDSILDDTPKESRALGGVPDWDGKFMGRISAARALLASRNVAAEQAMEMAGINNVITFAHGLGITTPIAPNASSAIGTSALRMIDHASAYAAFANGGHRVKAHGILRVADKSGGVIADYSQPADLGTVMTPSQAWTITSILRGYAHYWGIPIKWDTAGKSGSTDNTVDAYYMDYTPDWVVATWVGHTEGDNPADIPMQGVFGSTSAHYIAAPFINSLPRPHAFTPVAGSLSDCATQDASLVPQSSCPTPTPSPTPMPTPTPSPTETPTLCPAKTPASPGALPVSTPTPCV